MFAEDFGVDAQVEEADGAARCGKQPWDTTARSVHDEGEEEDGAESYRMSALHLDDRKAHTLDKTVDASV